MSFERYSNHGGTTLNGAINNSVTSLVVTSANGLPASGNFRLLIEGEIIIVGARSGTSLSGLIRGAEGTTAASHADGTPIYHVNTAQAQQNIIYQQPAQLLDLAKELMNFPSLEPTSSNQPLWFQVSANATLTEAAALASVSDETYGTRALKVVTTASAKYATQRFTYIDQPRVKNGRSAGIPVAIWSVGSAPARVRIQSSVGSLAVSEDVTAAAWTVVVIDPVALDGTWAEIRFEVDNGTAYFIPLTDRPRIGRTRWWLSGQLAEDLNGSAAKARADVDCTAFSGALAYALYCQVLLRDDDNNDEIAYHVYPNGFAAGANQEPNRVSWIKNQVSAKIEPVANAFRVLCDDGQIIETELTMFGGTNVDLCRLYVVGWEEWS